jgi:CHRD domain
MAEPNFLRRLNMKSATLAVAVSLLLGTTAFAGPVYYSTLLNGLNEGPPNISPATGFAEVAIDSVAQTMHVHIDFSGLIGTTTASHIHCCETTPFANANVGVATQTPRFIGFPTGVTSGTYDHDFDLTQASTYNPAFVTAQGGLANAEAALLAGIANNETYLNIHTTVYPAGEIRGILSLETPEPGTFLLAGAMLAGLLSRRRK